MVHTFHKVTLQHAPEFQVCKVCSSTWKSSAGGWSNASVSRGGLGSSPRAPLSPGCWESCSQTNALPPASCGTPASALAQQVSLIQASLLQIQGLGWAVMEAGMRWSLFSPSVTSDSFWDPMDCSTSGSPVLRCLLGFAQIDVH